MFDFLSPYMFWIKIGAAICAMAAIFGSGMWLEGTIKQHEIDQAKIAAASKAQQDAQTSLAQFEQDAGSIHAAAMAYGAQQANINSQFAAISKGLKDAIKSKPLPVDCVPDDERLRTLRAAIAAANNPGAGQPLGPALPHNP